MARGSVVGGNSARPARMAQRGRVGIRASCRMMPLPARSKDTDNRARA